MALTTITCDQRDPVDACHDINTLNVQMPLPPPKDNRRLWLHHLNVWPSLFSSGGGLSLERLQCAAQRVPSPLREMTETAKFSSIRQQKRTPTDRRSIDSKFGRGVALALRTLGCLTQNAIEPLRE
jgi:hypothetical protein